MGAQGNHPVNTTERLAALRALMAKPVHNVTAIVVPSADQHSSEYLADCDARRAFLSGFTGSAGCAIVTAKEALLFTDGRYFLQAGNQLDDNWQLMKQIRPDVGTWQEYLAKHLETNSRVGIDSTLISAGMPFDATSLTESLAARQSSLIPLESNLVDEIWGGERPSRPKNAIVPLDVKFAGKSSKEKIANVQEHLKTKQASALVLHALDEVAWLLNLRGSDIAFNPVFFSYAVVTPTEAILFVDRTQIGDAVVTHLGPEVKIQPYTAFFTYLRELGRSSSVSKESPVLLGSTASFAVATAIGREKIQIVRSPVETAKSIKNETEVEGFRQCHVRDGSALVRYFAWLEEQLAAGAELNESQVADQLQAFRSELDLFKGLSFTTISSTGPNGAIIHYSPDPADCAIVKKEQVYLCDSGAQFSDGTTDTTRTFHFGTPTSEEKRAFTRVLQGHIAIDTAVFPDGISGYHLDPFARRPLWEDGLDYRHGTGHGVGHFLNVHEGPQGIGLRIAYNETPLKPGMTLSNEPGYYAEGQFGIRIENIVIVRNVQTRENFGGLQYLGFEHVTMCPMGRTLVDVELLSVAERKWLNAYHAEVWQKVSPLLASDPRALAWLKKETAAI